MQEEVENRTLTLVVSGTKFTGRMFKAAISKYMAHRKEKKLEKQRSRDAPVVPHGKQTVKQLVGQNPLLFLLPKMILTMCCVWAAIQTARESVWLLPLKSRKPPLRLPRY